MVNETELVVAAAVRDEQKIINLLFALFDAYLQMSIRDPEPMHMIKLYSLVFSFGLI